MIRRLRLLLPPAPYLTAFALIYLLLEGPSLYFEWRFGGQAPARPAQFVPQVAAFAYGAFRVLGFHPFYRPEYRAWLELTPWTHRRPLPVGPVSIAWEDGVVLSLLCLFATVTPGGEPLRLLILFLFAFLACLTPALAWTGARACGYGLAFGLGLVLHLWPDPLAALLTVTLLALVAHLALWRSLRRFPWPLDWQKKAVAATTGGQLDLKSVWPYSQLGPKPIDSPGLGGLDAVLIGALAGWWLYVGPGFVVGPRGRVGLTMTLCLEFLIFIAPARLLTYVVGYAPPISLWGRLVTRRWIIPGYDVVFVAPLCALLVPAAVFYEMMRAGFAPDVTGPACVALSLALALGMGPSLERWRLTGRHRIFPVVRGQGRNMVKVG